jgi:triphosphoribosyl-dephospho-CoA synthetase
MDLRREILRNVVLCQALEPLARKPHLDAMSSGPKIEYFLVAGVNSAWPFYDLADRVLTAGRQPDCIFDVAYEAQSASVRNRYGGKVNFGQISLLVPLVTAQILDYLESGTHEDIDSILARTGDVLRNTTEKDVEYLQKFMDLGYEVAAKNRERTGNPKPSRTPVLQGRYANIWDICIDRQQILMVREMAQGYPHSLQVYRFLLHNLDNGIVPASALIYQLLVAELGRPDVVADIIAVGIYLVLTKHPESVLFT